MCAAARGQTRSPASKKRAHVERRTASTPRADADAPLSSVKSALAIAATHRRVQGSEDLLVVWDNERKRAISSDADLAGAGAELIAHIKGENDKDMPSSVS